MNVSTRSLPAPEGPVFHLDLATLERGIAASRENVRGRIMMPLQRDASAGVQRLLNFMQPGSYVQPHCHPESGAIETVIPVRGSIALWIFDVTGKVLAQHRLQAGIPDACLVDIEAGVWHTFSATELDTVVFEIKRGPYDPTLDKSFAPWAPFENDAAAPAYLADLLAEVI